MFIQAYFLGNYQMSITAWLLQMSCFLWPRVPNSKVLNLQWCKDGSNKCLAFMLYKRPKWLKDQAINRLIDSAVATFTVSVYLSVMINVSPSQKLFSVNSPFVFFLFHYIWQYHLGKNKTPFDLLITNELLCYVYLCIFNMQIKRDALQWLCARCENY